MKRHLNSVHKDQPSHEKLSRKKKQTKQKTDTGQEKANKSGSRKNIKQASGTFGKGKQIGQGSQQVGMSTLYSIAIRKLFLNFFICFCLTIIAQ